MASATGKAGGEGAFGDVAPDGATVVAGVADAIGAAGKSRAADVADAAPAVGGVAGSGKLSPLASVSATRAVLEAHGLATKHALGQNFLINDDILKKIVQLAGLGPTDFVLEVGPGIGTLTIALLKNAARVVSVERDADLPAVLKETLEPWADRFALVGKDALDLTDEDLRQAAGATDEFALGGGVPAGCADGANALRGGSFAACECAGGDALVGEAIVGDAVPSDRLSALDGSDFSASNGSSSLPNKFVANLPYAVAATLVLDYFRRFPHLQSATVMVQREVADRMAATPGNKNYGAYTVKLGMHARPAGRFAVGPGNFFPPPHVDSAVLRLDRRIPLDDAGNPLTAEEIDAACIMADAAFASRRKTLMNSCKTYFGGRGEEGAALALRLGELFELAGIDGKRRGETLSQAEFIRLGKAYLRMI